ncbi:hypothetical protein ACFRFL_41890 [Streptomyces sp. NPDC056708]|uniref:hypothetical protein n=1 Tax=unclassified Streptomyces TaxID=2593676 RepID=UPI0036A69780
MSCAGCTWSTCTCGRSRLAASAAPPHLHVCHRPGNPNRAEAKSKHPWRVEHGFVTGGLIKRVSPAMVHTYFEYVTTEYPRGAGHGMLLVQLHGADTGQPWAPVGARRMLGRAGKRAGPGVEAPCLPALVYFRGSRRRRRQPAHRQGRRRLGLGRDGG